MLKRALDLPDLSGRPTLLYINTRRTNPLRAALVDQMKKHPFAKVEEVALGFQQYLDQLASSVFVLSPFGNGIDCHRTWEVSC